MCKSQNKGQESPAATTPDISTPTPPKSDHVKAPTSRSQIAIMLNSHRHLDIGAHSCKMQHISVLTSKKEAQSPCLETTSDISTPTPPQSDNVKYLPIDNTQTLTFSNILDLPQPPWGLVAGLDCLIFHNTILRTLFRSYPSLVRTLFHGFLV